MTYCIYHIPGKKIGVTNDLEERVTRQQGYEPHEYEILEMSDDIGYISIRERQLQRMHGYPVDRVLYKDLKPNIELEPNIITEMNINVTEQTTTFPFPINKLKGHLMDNMGMRWQTDHGEFVLNQPSISWIMNHVKQSYYNNDRCFVYNKAFAKWFDGSPYRTMSGSKPNCSPNDTLSNLVKVEDRFELIRAWATERGLYAKGDTKTQYLKLMEEAGELGRAILKSDQPEIEDAIGDIVVVLTNLAHLAGTSIESCVDGAYNVISKRTGKMVNGTFVKTESL